MNSSDTSSITCKSCGTVFTGNYCNQCSEKVIRASDRSFKTFLSNLLVAITFADSKMIKTLWLVLKKPGFISREFAEGRRVRYLNPTSLFFVLNLIYFFFHKSQINMTDCKCKINLQTKSISKEYSTLNLFINYHYS